MITAAKVTMAVLVAALLQAVASQPMSLAGARPDFIVIVVACIGVLAGFSGGIWTGFGGGLMMATLVGVNYGSFLVSRTLAAALAGTLHEYLVRDSPFVPPIAVGSATIVSEVVYFLMAPMLHEAHWWLVVVVKELGYNVVLSLPVYFALRKLRVCQQADDTEVRSLPRR